MELKTKPTRKSPRVFIDGVANARRREDALVLLELFAEVTGEKAVMWGDSIVGYGRYHSQQSGGQKAMWPVTGFSPRKQNLVIYIMPGFESYEVLLSKLGKHRCARSCLYINKLADVDLGVLQALVKAAVDDMHSRYDCG